MDSKQAVIETQMQLHLLVLCFKVSGVAELGKVLCFSFKGFHAGCHTDEQVCAQHAYSCIPRSSVSTILARQ